MPIDGHEYIGLIRYTGPSVASGYMDAAKSAQALLGLSDTLRSLVSAQVPALAEANYEIPVRVESGSWQALIPQTIGEWIQTGLGFGVSTYVVTAAGQMAKKDFEDLGLRDVFAKSLEAIQWSIRLGKHLGTISRRTFESVRWRHECDDVGIPNDAGDLLYMPTDFLELCQRVPATGLFKLTSVVTEERRLEVVVRASQAEIVEAVEFSDKLIFCSEDASIVLPELKHGDSFDDIVLVTRGNENTNSLGFLYKDHILTCYPTEGSIVRFKAALFVKSRMSGTVSREDKSGYATEARPKINFTSLTPLNDSPSELEQFQLFDDEAV